MQFVRLTIAAILITLTMACAGQPPQWYRVKPVGLLSGEHIQRLIADGATSGYNQFGNPYKIQYARGGELIGTAGWKNEYSDIGAWWVEQDRMCWQWQNWRNGEKICYATARSGRYLRWFDETGELISQAAFYPAAHIASP